MKDTLVPALSCFAVLTVSACGNQARTGEGNRPIAGGGSFPAEAWNPANDPLNLGGGYERNFSRLPTSARLPAQAWSDSYWPSNEGGISARWNMRGSAPFSYQPPTREQAQAMSREQLAQLSPAEKYDIYKGRFDYPTVRRERKRVSPSDLDWEGLCHGWASVSYLYQEPRPVVVRGESGMEVPFGSSDVKALLTYVQSDISPGPSRSLGSRCNIDIRRSNPDAPECRDVNAGSLHLVLANHIGLKRQAFVADVTRDLEVWNQPIHAFSTRVIGEQPPSPGAAPGTVKELRVETLMSYTVEISPRWSPVLGTDAQAVSSRLYRYRLELDSGGRVIGGEWLDEDRPDFLWTQARPSFTGYFDKVDDIYQASIGDRPTPVTPIPQPTARPTIAPLPTVAPVPTVAPWPGRLGPIECPAGYRLTPVGDRGGVYCTDGSNAFGPYPSAMVERCEASGGGSACRTDRWDNALYLSLRGDGLCPAGSTFDARTTYCAEGDDIFGPFPAVLVERCRAAGGGAACMSARWGRSFYLSLVGG